MARFITLTAAVICSLFASALTAEPPEASAKSAGTKSGRMTTKELAEWIDARFADYYARAGLKPADTIDDATFLRRVFLDLQGRIPSVAQVRDFLADESAYKRHDYVDRLLAEERLPERFARRSADHMARVWRRMMIPATAPGAALAPRLDPWLARQFAANTPYDEVARKLLLAGDGREKSKSARRREQLLREMRALAEQTKVQFVNAGRADRRLELVKDPVFRYDDQPRRFIDATMWVWTEDGRPVAFQKIEAKHHVGHEPQWGYCFTSASGELLSVQWSETRTYRSKEPGVALRPLSDAPAVAAGSAQRKRQARELVRRFSARVLLDPGNNDSQEMRLLTTPIFEYTDPHTKELAGVVFGFSTNGTNPDLLILLEARGEKDARQWHFAPVRMTASGVMLKHQTEKVWDVSWVNWDEAPFPTWTFFDTPRVKVADE